MQTTGSFKKFKSAWIQTACLIASLTNNEFMQIFSNGKIIYIFLNLDFWLGVRKDHKTKLPKKSIHQDLQLEQNNTS